MEAQKEALVYKEYRHNPKYRGYVDRYCHMHGIGLEEAMKHHLVQVEAFNYYRDL